METLTVEQLRTAVAAGGISSVTLAAVDGEFFLQVRTMSNDYAVVARSRSAEPRPFPNPLSAMTLLWKLGIFVGSFDVANWDPSLRPLARRRPDRAEAMRRSYESMKQETVPRSSSVASPQRAA